MPTIRTKMELDVLRAEAQRRVRSGQPRADVARALGVAPTTLSQWALREGWRRKDLEAEDSAARARADAMAEDLRAQETARQAEGERIRETPLEDGLRAPPPDWVPLDPQKDPHWRERRAVIDKLEAQLQVLEAQWEAEWEAQESAETAKWEAEVAEGRCPSCGGAVDADGDALVPAADALVPVEATVVPAGASAAD